ncbi:MAG: hypothetical protein ACTTGJ_03725 [Clostridium sp.]
MIKENEKNKRYMYLGINLNKSKTEILQIIDKAFNKSNEATINLNGIIESQDRKIYRYVPISKLDILITSRSRDDKLKDKIKHAKSIVKYITPILNDNYNADNVDNLDNVSTEKNINFEEFTTFDISNVNVDEKQENTIKDKEIQDIENILETEEIADEKLAHKIEKKLDSENINIEEIKEHMVFLKMLETMSSSKIKEIEEIQQSFQKNEPFQISYPRAHFFEIYYVKETGRYVLLICSDEIEFNELYYVIRKKIQWSKTQLEEYIYTPISQVEYSETILKSNEILELEDELWYFTKSWPMTYELYDLKQNLSLVVYGKIDIYNGLLSTYRLKFKSREEALQFLKLIKALAILEKKTDKYLTFSPVISKKAGLEFTYEENVFTFEDLPEFLFLKYDQIYNELLVFAEKKQETDVRYNILEGKKERLEEKLNILQNNILMFQNSKKNIFSKVSYMFKKDPLKQVEKEIKTKIGDEKVLELEANKELKQVEEKKQKEIEAELNFKEKYQLKGNFCTIEEFLNIYEEYLKQRKEYGNNIKDIESITPIITNLEYNVTNAIKYITEISMEKKSLIGFLKYTNKDNLMKLKQTLEVENTNINQIENNNGTSKLKTFNFELDYSIFGENIDSQNRENLTEDEINGIYLAINGMLKYINMVKQQNINEESLELYLKTLQKEYEEYVEKSGAEYDIFGNISKDQKIRYIKDKSFRETDRNKFQILKYTKEIQKLDIIEKMYECLKILESSIEKIVINKNIDIYKIGNWSLKIKEDVYDIYNLDINEELKNIKEEDSSFNLFHLELSSEFKALFLSNIFFYNNLNKTLPLGMDISSQVLLDMSKYTYRLKEIRKVRVTKEEGMKAITKNLNIHIYKVYKKH